MVNREKWSTATNVNVSIKLYPENTFIFTTNWKNLFQIIIHPLSIIIFIFNYGKKPGIDAVKTISRLQLTFTNSTVPYLLCDVNRRIISVILCITDFDVPLFRKIGKCVFQFFCVSPNLNYLTKKNYRKHLRGLVLSGSHIL